MDRGDWQAACNAEDPSLIPGLGIFSGEGNGDPLQCSCLNDPMDRGAWQAPVHGVTKSWTRLSDATTTTTWSPTSSLRFKPSHSVPSQALGPSCLFHGKPSMGNRVIDLPTSTYSEALLSHPLPPAALAGLLIPAVQVSSGKEILGLVCQHCPSALCPSLACAARMIIH